MRWVMVLYLVELGLLWTVAVIYLGKVGLQHLQSLVFYLLLLGSVMTIGLQLCMVKSLNHLKNVKVIGLFKARCSVNKVHILRNLEVIGLCMARCLEFKFLIPANVMMVGLQNFVEAERSSSSGGSYHGVLLRHQQQHCRDLRDPTLDGVGGGNGVPRQTLLEGQGHDKSPRERSPQDALRSTNPTIPVLPAVGQKHFSIAAADWLVELKPLIGDISNRANKWWEATMSATEEAYQKWLLASRLQRLRIPPPDPVDYHGLGSEQVIRRLEQRVTTVLLPALPVELRNDLITNRQLWACAIIYKVLRCYQPGGWAERSALLTDLTNTTPAKTPVAAASALRLWSRQKMRARELGASVPDALLQVRALEMIVSQAVLKFPQSMFRISTFRMETARPTGTSLAQFLELLTAEMDAASLGTETSEGGASTNPSAKALQTGDGKPTSGGDGAVKPCRFWGSEAGCRHGRNNCKFQHGVLADQSKRCFHCSALDHRKQDCPHRDVQQPTSASSIGGSGKNGSGGGKGDKDSHKDPETTRVQKRQPMPTEMEKEPGPVKSPRIQRLQRWAQRRQPQVTRLHLQPKEMSNHQGNIRRQ